MKNFKAGTAQCHKCKNSDYQGFILSNADTYDDPMWTWDWIVNRAPDSRFIKHRAGGCLRCYHITTLKCQIWALLLAKLGIRV